MFNRSVLMHDGTTRRVHEAESVQLSDGKAIVHMRSWESEKGKGGVLDTWLQRERDTSAELAAAESWAVGQDEFAEHEDPLADLVEEMEQQAEQQAALVEELASILTDEQAASVPGAYQEWAVGISYLVGDRRRYEDVLYKCLQAHTSQEGWEPSQAPSLWARILNPDPEVIPVWEQPYSANPYMTGDKVHYPDAEGPVYESTIDNNVWSPEAYPAGWQLVEEEA